MPVKVATSETKSHVPSFDGQCYSAWPTGNKPSGYLTTPYLIDTDVVDGQISGGEGGGGVPITLLGYSFGRAADLGTPSGARVYMRDPLGDNAWHEVSKYWWLAPSRVYGYNQTVELCFEPGSLGGSMVAGRSLDIKINVNGVDSNILLSQFTIQPANFYWCNASGGNDATGVVNDKTHPFSKGQKFVSGSTYTGIWATLAAGDTILFEGEFTTPEGFDSRWLRFRHHSGTAPTGSAGNGYIKLLAKPTIFGRSNWHYTDPAGGNGGIHGVNSAYYNTWGKYVVISGYRGESSPTSGSDAGPLNLQTGAIRWRIFGCELGPWAVDPGQVAAKAGGIAGQAEDAVIRACYIHDISGTAALENHGIYLGDAAGHCSKRVDISHNAILRITGGSTFQMNNNAAADTFDNILFHHNYSDGCAKFGINLSNSVLSLDCYNNIVRGAKLNSWRCGSQQTGQVLRTVHNTFEQSESSNGTEGSGIIGANAMTSGSVLFASNILVRAGNGGSQGVSYITISSSSAVTVTKQLYYDTLGTLTTVPAIDATGIYGDPLFTDRVAGNLTVQTGSPALSAVATAEPFAIASDFFGIQRPVPGTGAPGASPRNTIGATEGVGT